MFVCLTVQVADGQVGGQCLISILNRHDNASTPVNSKWHFIIGIAFIARLLMAFPIFLTCGAWKALLQSWTPTEHNGPFFHDIQCSALYPLSFKAINVCVRRCSYMSGPQPWGSEQPGLLINQKRGLGTVSREDIHSPSIWYRLSITFPGFCLYCYQFGEVSSCWSGVLLGSYGCHWWKKKKRQGEFFSSTSS